MTYDYEDRITQISLPGSVTDTFTYNGLDTRATKDDSTGSYSFVRDGADVTDPVLDDGAANYTPGVSRHTAAGTIFDNLNYIGTSTRQTNSSQATTATRTYDAFGNLFTSTGTPVGPFGFVGQGGYQEDHDSGLKLLGHRYYDPSTGRFLTRDPAKDSRNWYTYCKNNPLGNADADGLQAKNQNKGRGDDPLWWDDAYRNQRREHLRNKTKKTKEEKQEWQKIVDIEKEKEKIRNQKKRENNWRMQQELDELIIESEAAGETLEIIEISGTVIEGGLIIAAG